MSLFRTFTVACPSCGGAVEFSVVNSVNAARRPDLRDAVLDGSFQRNSCPTCNESFRVEPEFNYLDVGRNQWIAAFPLSKLGEWEQWEQHAREIFDKAFGAQASAPAQSIGADLTARLTFGWAALREKLVAAEQKLDDVTLELCKIAILRGQEGQPLANHTELRLYGFEGQDFIMGWIVATSEYPVDMLRVPRSLYDEIVEDPEGWQELRKELSAGLFVDAQRLMLAPA
jgi:hypothetical protein